MRQALRNRTNDTRKTFLCLAMFLPFMALVWSASYAHSSDLYNPGEAMGQNQDAACPIPPVPPPSFPRDPGRMPYPVMKPPFPFFDIIDLGLDGEQRESIREIHARTIRDSARKHAEILVARMELEEITHKKPIDIGAIEGKLKQVAALDLHVRLSHFKAMAEIESKLTPEQRKRLVSIQTPPERRDCHPAARQKGGVSIPANQKKCQQDSRPIICPPQYAGADCCADRAATVWESFSS